MSLFVPPTATNMSEWVRKAASALNSLLTARNVMEVLDTAPANPAVGRFYFDTTLVKPRVWDGTAWQNLY
jgi:hypothetical protein